jgi:predicted MFS family arabinose efflux permease
MYHPWGGIFVALATTNYEELNTEWKVGALRGLLVLGAAVGVFSAGTAVGMELGARAEWVRAVLMLFGVACTMMCFMSLRVLKDELAKEQEEVARLRAWKCASRKRFCKDPVPHVHADATLVFEDDVVYV